MAKILLFEDDAVQIELIKRHIGTIGHVLIVAKNGLEGISLARKEKPDLILMDMIMPGMHGLEATIKLKEDPLTADIPIMALTIMSSPKFVQECYRAGIIGYLKKPFNPAVLIESIEKVVGKPQRLINKVLIVAGASRLATMVEMKLLRQGYQVNSFPGGKSAISHLEENLPDAIFLDISLPEKHLSAVFEKLGAMKPVKPIPVVLMSSQLSAEALEQEVVRRGAHDCLTSASDLSDVLRRVSEPVED
jgi:twitching motility two-component system response regulator PilH